MFYPVIFIGLGLSLRFLTRACSSYVSKIQYNSKRDLIFVDRINWNGSAKTHIYEIDHLERNFPFLKT